MKTQSLKFILPLAAAFFFALTSCQKEKTEPSYDNSITAKDAQVENIYDNVTNIADEAYEIGSTLLDPNHKSGGNGNGNGGGNGAGNGNNGGNGGGAGGDQNQLRYRMFLSDCATISLDTTVMPHELTIDFGEENCLCNDGRYRRGKIIISFTGRYRDPGTIITTGFEDYHVNDNKVDGSKVVTNMGPNDEGHPWFDVQVTGLVTLKDESGTISWNANRTRTWTEGYDTRPRRDDVYEIEGEADGIRATGESWEREIITPLRREMNCRWIVSGTVEVRPENKTPRLLDFGDGNCDNIATITIDGVTYTITLR